MDRHDNRAGIHAFSENVRRSYSWARHIAVNHSEMGSFNACSIPSNRRYGNLRRVACVTSEQHVDLRESDQKRDNADTATFLTWLDLHHPFQRASPLLASLASGGVASAAVNCDDALSVGEASVKAMGGKRFSEIHLQRRNNVRSLARVTKAVKVRGEDVCINPNQLFHRIVCIVRSEEELTEYLTYELAACPRHFLMTARCGRETNPPLSQC